MPEFWKSKTFWGVVSLVVGIVTHPEVLSLFPKELSGIILAVGSALTAWGLRHGQIKVEDKVDENTAITLDAAGKQ